jgi:Fe2+ transport system protein FeoA
MNSNKTGYPLNFNFRNLCYALRSADAKSVIDKR